MVQSKVDVNEVTLYGLKPDEVIAISRELKSQHGLILGVDFDFSYHPANFDEYDNGIRHTVFTFRDSKWCSWIVLKYM